VWERVGELTKWWNTTHHTEHHKHVKNSEMPGQRKVDESGRKQGGSRVGKNSSARRKRRE